MHKYLNLHQNLFKHMQKDATEMDIENNKIKSFKYNCIHENYNWFLFHP